MSTLDVTEVAAYLRLKQTDDQLQDILDAAERLVEARTLPLVARTLIATVPMRAGSLTLPHAPVRSVLAISSAAGSGLGPGDPARNDLDAGVVVMGNGYTDWTRQTRPLLCSVTYVAGFADDVAHLDQVPASVVLAVKELTRHLWQTQRGGNQGQGGPAPAASGPAYALPNRVLELLAPDDLPVFA